MIGASSCYDSYSTITQIDNDRRKEAPVNGHYCGNKSFFYNDFYICDVLRVRLFVEARHSDAPRTRRHGGKSHLSTIFSTITVINYTQ